MLQACRRVKLAAAVAVFSLALNIGARGGEPSPAPEAASDWRAFQKTVQPFLAKHCFECHAAKKRGDVRLDQFQNESALANGLATLETAADMLRTRAMPPPKQPQPANEEIKPVLSWLDSYSARVEQERPARGGRVMVRRLNRTEYNNTVHDLLGVTLRPADDFPADVPAHGFDTVAGTLSVVPALVEKYLSAAETVARTAVFGVEPMEPQRVSHQPWFTGDAFSKNKTPKFVYDETGMSLHSALHVVQRFTVDGEYKLRTIMRGSRPGGSKPLELGFWIDGKLVHQATLKVPERKTKSGLLRAEVNGLWAEVQTPISAGEHWLAVTILRMFDGLPPAYGGPNPANTDAGISVGVDAHFPMYLDVVGPYEQPKGPSQESLKKIFGGPGLRPLYASGVREIIGRLARRAYRRPVTDREVDDLVKLVAMAQQDGESVEEGLSLAIQQMLISPYFLFRVEHSPGEASAGQSVAQPITQHELATRLSYFLWSSMPDDELLRLADEQKLRDPELLEAQVRRMLQDARALALVENFGGQWLQTRALESRLPDRNKFLEYTEYTRMSIKKETDLFFEHVLREDRSILDFIDANYTFLNQRLADFYNIPGVKGHEFRKVDLTGTRRGGVWTQASVLIVSSYPHRTSPVLRGKWLLENLLNAPTPPPPPNVPSLDETELGKAVSVRQQLEVHRSSANCASCHARMDPLGLALENFDAVGMWRDKDGDLPIDASGSLPDGRSFKGHEELRSILKSDPQAFARCLGEKMLIYALGRGLERGDRATVNAIALRLATHEYRFSSLILGVILSPQFQGSGMLSGDAR